MRVQELSVPKSRSQAGQPRRVCSGHSNCVWPFSTFDSLYVRVLGKVHQYFAQMNFVEQSQDVSNTHPRCDGSYCHNIRHRRHDNISLLSSLPPLLADPSQPRKCLPGGNLETDSMGVLRLKCSHWPLSYHDTNPYALEFELEIVEEGCCNSGTQRRRAHHHLRDLEECIRYCCKSNLFNAHDPPRLSQSHTIDPM